MIGMRVKVIMTMLMFMRRIQAILKSRMKMLMMMMVLMMAMVKMAVMAKMMKLVRSRRRTVR